MEKINYRLLFIIMAVFLILPATGCDKTHKIQPMSFKSPDSYGNTVEIAGAKMAAKAFNDTEEAKAAFGYDILGAGLLPVQVVFDNTGENFILINGTQTFIEDASGNLWPVLSSKTAYERASKYAHTKEIFKSGGYTGFLGATAGAIIGAAIGIVAGNSVGDMAGKGAAIGGAAGLVVGGAESAGDKDARRQISNDLQDKSLQNKAIPPTGLSHGILFFPGEAKEAVVLRLQIKEKESGKAHIVIFQLKPVE